MAVRPEKRKAVCERERGGCWWWSFLGLLLLVLLLLLLLLLLWLWLWLCQSQIIPQEINQLSRRHCFERIHLRCWMFYDMWSLTTLVFSFPDMNSVFFSPFAHRNTVLVNTPKHLRIFKRCTAYDFILRLWVTNIPSLKLTAKAPERKPNRKMHLPTIDFQVQAFKLVSWRVSDFKT